MRIRLFLKVVAMMAALVMVISIIRNLNSSSVEKAFDALGIAPSSAPADGPNAAGDEFNICRRGRITGFFWPSGRRLLFVTEGPAPRWIAFHPAPREIPHQEVEGWMNRYCRIRVKPIEQVIDGAAMPRSLEIGFSDGVRATLRRYSGARYDLRELGEARPVRSPELDVAITHLESIGRFQPEVVSGP